VSIATASHTDNLKSSVHGRAGQAQAIPVDDWRALAILIFAMLALVARRVRSQRT
jgi:hypothetical protein